MGIARDCKKPAASIHFSADNTTALEKGFARSLISHCQHLFGYGSDNDDGNPLSWWQAAFLTLPKHFAMSMVGNGDYSIAPLGSEQDGDFSKFPLVSALFRNV